MRYEARVVIREGLYFIYGFESDKELPQKQIDGLTNEVELIKYIKKMVKKGKFKLSKKK